MTVIYVVIENGDPYPSAYTSFVAASEAVKTKYRETVEEQIAEGGTCSEIDVPENTSGTTYLYVEKGIHIYIYRLPVL